MPITAQFTAAGPSIRLTGGIDMQLCLSLLDELNLLHIYYQFARIELQIDRPGGEANALAFLVEELAPWRTGKDRVLRTVGLSEVSSAAALLLSLGTKGHRAAKKNSRLLYHSVRMVYSSGAIQTGTQLRSVTQKLDIQDKYFCDLIADHVAPGDILHRTKLKNLFQKEEQITPQDALALRLIDEVL